eukprot:TRINITY_DN9558_c0_g1_i2.p1 TRINITY_DN9558_c0_g1~~TRINITY_DN9558_c0_g1_i2.p1  ORF type:complete len:367 (-),score=118.62 TRINITY_DN9558_c0_g1_i2:108-1208(-)
MSTKEKTKKSRPSDDNETPKKKVKLEDSRSSKSATTSTTTTTTTKATTKTFTITDVKLPQKDATPPFVVYFPGIPPSADKLESISCFESTKKTANNAPSDKILAMETSKLIYSGSSRAVGDLCKYVVGVVDKSDGSIKLAELPHIYTMQHELKMTPTNRTIKDTSSLTNQRHKLVEAFGSRRRLQGLRQALANAVTEDNVTSGDVIQKALKKKAEENQFDSHTREDIPPYNENATTKEDAYPVENIIANEDWTHLKGDSKEVLLCFRKGGRDKWETFSADSHWPRVVVSKLKEMLDENDTADRKKVASLLVYLTYLMRFYHRVKGKPIPTDAIQKEASYSVVPEFLFHKFLKQFAELRSGRDDTQA